MSGPGEGGPGGPPGPAGGRARRPGPRHGELDVRITSRTRRTAALMAASSIGLSTLVLGVTGVASASDTEDFSFTPEPGQTETVPAPLTVPAGYCSIDWSVQGGSGGGSTAGDDGGYGTLLEGTTALD